MGLQHGRLHVRARVRDVVGGSVNISSITCDGVGITAKVMVKNDATFDATKGDLYAKLLESAEKHEVELSFEKRIVLQPPASE